MSKKSAPNISALLLQHRAPKKKTTRDNPDICLPSLKQCSKCLKETSGEHCSNCKTSTNLADLVHNAYIELQDAKANFSTIEGTLIEQVRKVYEKFAQDGNFSKTFDVNGTDTSGVQVSFKDAFCDLEIEKKDELKSRLKGDFDQYFQEERKLSLRDTGDATIQFLMDKLGQEKFLELFEIKLSLVCKPDMDRRQFDLDTEVQLALRQHKPSTKLRSE